MLNPFKMKHSLKEQLPKTNILFLCALKNFSSGQKRSNVLLQRLRGFVLIRVIVAIWAQNAFFSNLAWTTFFESNLGVPLIKSSQASTEMWRLVKIWTAIWRMSAFLCHETMLSLFSGEIFLCHLGVDGWPFAAPENVQYFFFCCKEEKLISLTLFWTGASGGFTQISL